MMGYKVYGGVQYRLWSGTSFFPILRRARLILISRNVPGVAIYFYALSAIRTELSYLTQFQTISNFTSSSSPASNTNGNSISSGSGSGSALVKLSVPGNLIAGAIARTSVGFVLNPITVLKARYEVRQAYRPTLTCHSVEVQEQELTARVIDILNIDHYIPRSKIWSGHLELGVYSKE